MEVNDFEILLIDVSLTWWKTGIYCAYKMEIT